MDITAPQKETQTHVEEVTLNFEAQVNAEGRAAKMTRCLQQK